MCDIAWHHVKERSEKQSDMNNTQKGALPPDSLEGLVCKKWQSLVAFPRW